MSTNPNTSGQPGRQDSTAYIEELRRRRTRAERRYQIAKSRAEHIQARIDDLTSLKDNLQLYWSRIEQTDKLAQGVISTIDCYDSLMQRVACNVDLTNQAVQGLTIDSEEAAQKIEDIEDFFDASIKYPISCLTPAQQPAGNSPIHNAINQLDSAIREAMSAAADSLTKSLKTYQHTQMLHDYVGDQDGSSGLAKVFAGMRSTIHIDDHPGSKIHFPRSGCPNDRWDRTKEAYDELVAKIERLNEWKIRLLQRANLAEDRKNAIGISLTAAENAAR